MSFSPRSLVTIFNPSFVLKTYSENELERDGVSVDAAGLWVCQGGSAPLSLFESDPSRTFRVPLHQEIEFIGGEMEEAPVLCDYCGQLHAYRSFMGGCPSCGAPVNSRRARMVESRPLLKVTNH